jgi:pimeloyl-[acyl-carrier protein] methyl ester esterase
VTLYRESIGEGSNVALLHGWGLHGGVFASLAAALSRRHRVHVVDLPGHGHSPWSKGTHDLEGLSRTVAAHLPARCALIGWSLGGLVAQRIGCLFPERVSHLVLIATGAVGSKRRDFPHAADPALLAGLGERLQKDWRSTVLEFLNLEVRGDANPLEALRVLRQQVDSHGPANPAALAAYLEILRTTDLRHAAPTLRAPTLVIAGEYDRLTPPDGARQLAAWIPGARLEIVPKAAHAPFLSHRSLVERWIEEFLAP